MCQVKKLIENRRFSFQNFGMQLKTVVIEKTINWTNSETILDRKRGVAVLHLAVRSFFLAQHLNVKNKTEERKKQVEIILLKG